MKLPGKVAAADNPNVLAARGCSHLGVHVRDTTLNKPDIGMFDCWKLPVREDPRRLLVGPWRTSFLLDLDCVPQHPLVSRGAHSQGPNLCYEARIARVVDIAEREQPLE